MKDSPYRFTRAHWSRPLIWLAEGWVVLERFAMPILVRSNHTTSATLRFACGRDTLVCKRQQALEPSLLTVLLWAARSWLWVQGEGDAEPNDTFVQQVVANASAACEEVIRRGVTTPGPCDQPTQAS